MIDFVRENSYSTPFANSPLLPLLVLSLATQKNSPTRLQTPSTIYSEYDYIIVGAGSAGSTIAARLSELPCVNVLLLEAGKSPPMITDVPAIAADFLSSDIDWQYKTVPQNNSGRLIKNRQLPWPGGKGIGGSSLLHQMLYVRGNKKNYDDWADQGAKGWSYEEVLPYFIKAEDNGNIKEVDSNYHGEKGPITVEKTAYKAEIKDPLFQAAQELGYEILDSNGAKQTGFYDIQATVRRQQRCSTAKGYLVPAENRENLHILPNALVNKIIIQDKTAVGVSFKVDGIVYTVRARREVIMSAGTTNTAQLLMLSGIGPRQELHKFGIPVVSDLPVGENLQNHCSVVMGFEVNPSITPLKEKKTNSYNMQDYIDNRKGVFASIAVGLAFLNGQTVRPPVDDPNFQLYFAEYSVPNSGTSFGMIEEAFNQVFGPYINSTLYICISQILKPKSRGYVKLQSADPRTPPLIDPNYYGDPKDVNDVVEGMKVCQRIGTSQSMKRIGSKPLKTLYPGCEQFQFNEDDYFRCQALSVVNTMGHQVGTVKMGDPQDPSTVVDPQLRVKGVDGLRVVDASVMPIIPSGNTNAPTIMIAEKAADIIKQSIKCPSAFRQY